MLMLTLIFRASPWERFLGELRNRPLLRSLGEELRNRQHLPQIHPTTPPPNPALLLFRRNRPLLLNFHVLTHSANSELEFENRQLLGNSHFAAISPNDFLCFHFLTRTGSDFSSRLRMKKIVKFASTGSPTVLSCEWRTSTSSINCNSSSEVGSTVGCSMTGGIGGTETPQRTRDARTEAARKGENSP